MIFSIFTRSDSENTAILGLLRMRFRCEKFKERQKPFSRAQTIAFLALPILLFCRLRLVTSFLRRKLPSIDRQIITRDFRKFERTSGAVCTGNTAARSVARARAERKFAATQARKTATATSGCIMGPRYCQSHLPAARDSTTSTISGRRRAPWRQRLLSAFPPASSRTRRHVARKRSYAIVL